MTNTKTTTMTKTNLFYFGVLAVLAMMAAMLLTANRPAHAETTFVVNTVSDEEDAFLGDGVCEVGFGPGGFCTLRAAIQQANASQGRDVIEFHIFGDSGVQTITPSTPLPPITEQLTVDGFSQPGASPNTLAKGTNAELLIELSGSGLTNAGDHTGLSISASDSVVQGLVINRFGGAGVHIFDTASLVRLEQNFIGTDPTGTQDFGNAIGVLDEGLGTSIGGNFPQDANLISGNDGPGIAIRNRATSTQASHNLIGTDKSGTKRLGNAEEGVEITGSSNNSLENNTIAFNGGDGVKVSDAAGSRLTVGANSIFSNSMFSNGGLGIDLVGGTENTAGVTANDGDNPSTPQPDPDSDSGPNGLQNKPVLSSAKTVSGKTTIVGKLNSSPQQTYTIQFFSNPSGNEGKKLIGQKSVTTDASGNRTFTFSPATAVSVGQTVTATATNTSSSGDTSEFSAPKTVASS